MDRARAGWGGRSFVVAMVHMLMVTGAWAETPVPGGEVSGTWAAQGSPYKIEGDITVPNDSALVIEPGVTVEFQGHYELLVNGSLRAIGTEADSILFTINDTTGWSTPDTMLGGWKHIRLFEPLATNDSTILDYCRIQYGKAIGPNWPFNHGGAISVVGFDKVRISNCLIINNMSGVGQGPAAGGIGVTYCDIAIIGNTIAFNHSQAGGGIQLSHSNSVLQYNTIRENVASGNGGGIEILGDNTRPAVVSLRGDTIAENTAGPGGGGINAVDVDSLLLEAVVLERNRAHWGGGVGTFNSTLFLTACLLEENATEWLGGGIAADYCTLWINETEFLRNLSQDAAGAMHNDHCVVFLVNSAIKGNHSGNDTLAGPAGGINAYASSLDVKNSYFSDNVTAGNGGAISADSTTLTVAGTEITGNAARFAGGGIHMLRSVLEIRNASIAGNHVGNDSIAGFGGGLRTVDCSAEISDCRIDSNRATGSGGGIATLSDNLLLVGTSLGSNRSFWNGGGISAERSSLVLTTSELVGNVAGNDSLPANGGGMDAFACEIIIEMCTIRSDTATEGAGLKAYNCDLDIEEALFANNIARGDGAGLHYVADSTYFGRPYQLRIANSSFEANTAVNQTGGARIVQSSDDSNQVALTIDHCIFRENEAWSTTSLRILGWFRDISLTNSIFVANRSARQAAGAGITGGWGTVANCLFARNIAGSDTLNASGSGLSVTQDARVDVLNCTFAQNTASGATALSIRSGAQVRLTNSIAWGNAGLPIAVVTGASSAGCQLWVNHSLVEHGADSINHPDSLSVLHWGMGNLDEDPVFEDPVKGDYHLNSASPCIGRGIDSIEIEGHWVCSPASDLEGNPRPAPAGTRPDMGAYEEGLTIPVAVKGETSDARPVSFALYQNYPNPFNPETSIRFDLPVRAHVALEVFDLLGRRISVLLDEVREAGRWSVGFSQPGLASGLYVYRLRAGTRVFAEKMLLMH